MVKKLKTLTNRQKAIARLLRPIGLNMEWPLSVRNAEVNKRHLHVAIAYPFLTASEKRKASVWRKKGSTRWTLVLKE